MTAAQGISGPYDVVVVGGGNSGLCAAISAAESGASVLLAERAGEAERGGNAAFSAGGMRVAYASAEDLMPLLENLPEEKLRATDFGSYDESQFLDDLTRLADGRVEEELASTIVSLSLETVTWLADKDVRFQPIYGRQAFEVGGRFRFWGGLTIEVVGRGAGLIQKLYALARSAGVDIRYQASGSALALADGRVAGVWLDVEGSRQHVPAKAVILASGGFQVNAEWRTRYLGPNWDQVKVCGTRHNTGDGIRMALNADAIPWGNWAAAHAVPWDLNAPVVGNLAVGDGYQKLSYPFGIMVNIHGQRFLDEGADFRNYTYATYGKAILGQPKQLGWQIFDDKTTHLLRDEYRTKGTTKVVANDLEKLASDMGVDVDQFVQTVREFNAAVDTTKMFDPNIKDGLATRGLTPNKSNWANPIDAPPFEAYGVTCGITSTYGGLRVTPKAEVVNKRGRPIPGLYACGEMVGGLFFENSPGGTALTAGAVLGRQAGREAANLAGK
jgi:tricarballylate dehydrogenase